MGFPAIRTCAECSKEFAPSSGHLRCPTCRSRDVCACGSPKQRASSTCAGCRREDGEFNSNWKGGGTKHQAGYMMRRVPHHPRAVRSKYVFEHILVMEQILGRYLLLTETVHHVNGVKDDNRPENLELWTRPQPSGIRVTDAVAWAREILARYDGPQVASPTSFSDRDR